jgi:hypothetical protein
MAITILVAIVSIVSNWVEHRPYAVVSRTALLAAALRVFSDPKGLEQLIRNRPAVAAAIAVIFLVLCAAYYVLFVVIPKSR